MGILEKEKVSYVARLARLRLTEEETKLFSRQLGDVLTYIEKLNELNTSDVPPTMHVLPLKNVFRKDDVSRSITQEDALSNAPHGEKGLFRVPKIIE
ncbi:MAG: Asp-tRNA(Asn)/Glu-tRNA(Gln) amidotransferase subunit GatC [Deltaproteobacteria bacterium]|nr:Asp-tRNA(Asn)/Glu-tRNA(Gln) amidotransferase subunit GatC [Deltaproteobacteria bacterium]